MELFSTRFAFSEMELSLKFSRIFPCCFRDYRDFRFISPISAVVKFISVNLKWTKDISNAKNNFKTAEITRKERTGKNKNG